MIKICYEPISNFYFSVKIMLFSCLCMIGSTQSIPAMPVVRNMRLLHYPKVARVLGIQGFVKVQVKTDGIKITDISIKSGPPLLVGSVKENLMSWEFEIHNPASFEVIFEYKIASKSVENNDNGIIILNLPVKVCISAKKLQLNTHDPFETTIVDK